MGCSGGAMAVAGQAVLPLEEPVFGKTLQDALSSRVPAWEGPRTPPSSQGLTSLEPHWMKIKVSVKR